MDDMEVDEGSMEYSPSVFSRSRRQTPFLSSPSVPAFSPLRDPATGMPGFPMRRFFASSSPVKGFADSPSRRRPNMDLFHSASVDVPFSHNSTATVPLVSPSRRSLPAWEELDGWRGSEAAGGTEGASCASMETSDRSDVSEMEVCGLSPSPRWDRVRSALGSFSLFTGSRPHDEQDELVEDASSDEQNEGVARKAASCVASWEPALSTVQVAGRLLHGKKCRSPPAVDTTTAAEMPLSTPMKRLGGKPSGDSVASGKRRSASATAGSHSANKPRSNCCGMCWKLFASMAVFVAMMYAILLQQRHNIATIGKDFTDVDEQLLKNEMSSKVFGQHIALDVIPRSISEYLSSLRRVHADCEEDACPVPPLVLSFHGWTGVGKNFVTDIITGLFSSRTVVKLLIPYHFPHKHQDEVYGRELEKWIRTNVTRHAVNFFVFDEMDKADPGVVQGIRSSLSKMREINSFRSPSIFMFLSNSFGARINQEVFQAMTESRTRESLFTDDFSHVFQFHDDGTGIDWYQNLRSAITVSIPFLPLERNHIVQCIRRDLVTKKLSTHADLVNRVLQELLFTTLTSGHQFSQTGCKRVSDKVNLVAFD